VDEVQIMGQEYIKKPTKRQRRNQAKQQKPPNQVPSLIAAGVQNIEFGQFFVDQRFQSELIQQPHKRGNDKKSGIDPQSLFSQRTGDENGNREQSNLNADLAKNGPENISDESMKGGQE